MSYENEIKEALAAYKAGALSDDEIIERFHKLSITDLGYASLDHDRSLRRGFPEVVYCEGKTLQQATAILQALAARHANVLGTRASKELFDVIKPVLPEAVYHELPRLIVLEKEPLAKDPDHKIAVITAGTSDVPVAEEAAVTAEVMGNEVLRIYDVGVAGIHRLLGRVDEIRSANVIVVIAGMEGALASVVGGLVAKPVIAVPTSVGYGANFKGLSALLGMLNSCSAGVAVVNIDNGFGAGRMASIINHLR
ncbi:MAG: nickel pincer cofactor biosynthesis protein LarB [Acidaminococcaceae bacterium]|nr:nickel pincer cofactor biosynthesis protein LarB [Acidaminococcaceae bacterium]